MADHDDRSSVSNCGGQYDAPNDRDDYYMDISRYYSIRNHWYQHVNASTLRAQSRHSCEVY